MKIQKNYEVEFPIIIIKKNKVRRDKKKNRLSCIELPWISPDAPR